MENLYNYLFWYNPHTSLWYAIPTDKHMTFFGKNDKSVALTDKDINVLIAKINKQ